MAMEEEPQCGARGCKCSLLWRAFSCVVVVAACIMLAYSIGESRHAVNSCWLKSSCLLFGDVAQHTTKCRAEGTISLPTGGPGKLCDFSMLSAAVQMVVAFILAVTVIVKTCCTRRASNSTAFSVLELVFCCVCGVAAIVTGIIVTAGTASFSTKLYDHWNATYGERFPDAELPSGPLDVYIFNNFNKTDGQPLYFLKTLFIGVVGSWLSALSWIIYVIVAAVSCHRWQRPKAAELKSVGKFTQFSNSLDDDQ